jgi:hypothetical protein
VACTERCGGRQNLGSTCYANALLQALFPLALHTAARRAEADPVVSALHQLFARLQWGAAAAVDARPVLEALGIPTGEQQDVPECVLPSPLRLSLSLSVTYRDPICLVCTDTSMVVSVCLCLCISLSLCAPLSVYVRFARLLLQLLETRLDAEAARTAVTEVVRRVA